MKKILIIGATSAIAEACAKIYAQRGIKLYLLARNEERLESMSKDLALRGSDSVQHAIFDANQFENHSTVIDSAIKALEGIDIALIAHGTLPDQQKCQQNFGETLQELNTNAISTISLLTHLANIFEQQGHGTIAVISSPAGDRGRQSNYVYGSAKAAVSVFLQGLRNRLFKVGVNVLTIKPGFVDTPMTATFKKGLLWAQADTVAEGIVSAIDKGKQQVYLPWFWRFIMLIILHIPETIFKRLKL